MRHALQPILSQFLSRIFWFVSRCIHQLLGEGPSCRFEPTCSQYVPEAFMKHGVLKGTWISAKRLGRCHPWGSHGWDPVPEVNSQRG